MTCIFEIFCVLFPILPAQQLINESDNFTPESTKTLALSSTVSFGCPSIRCQRLMLSVGNRATGFCGTEAVSIISLPNVFPETAQHADSVRLLNSAIAKSR